MATPSYVLLEKITVGAAGASSVTFTGIPQTGYTDLVIKASVRNTANVDWTGVYFNGVTTGYSNRAIQGTGAAVSSRSSTDKDLTILTGENAFTASTFGNAEVYIPNYTSANYKSYSVDTVTENNATTAYMELSAQLWSNTAAITSITLNAQSSLLAQNSTFYLYGVAKLGTTPAIVPYATGGDTIMTDGTYWYHAFKSSGTFTPAKGLSCDVLVVAGGGGGGYTNNSYSGGGGGGAGGVIAFASQSLANGIGYTATIGAGGAGATGLSAVNGSNSQFASLTAAVGGGGGASTFSGSGPGNGGSGGGGEGDVYLTGGTGTSGQGFAGGNGGGTQSSGGGGGAGAVGTNASGYTAGSGGTGTTSVTNWGALTAVLTAVGMGVSNYIAGGGGGGARTSGVAGTATGGGAAGGNAGVVGNNATANTGGGGGGAGSNYPTSSKNGGNGGSGMILVRYLV